MSTSTNTVYVTLDKPTTGTRQETVFEFGCRNAAGETTASGASGKIWTVFKGAVTRVDGTQMKYWNPANGSCQTMEAMLADPGGNGTCAAWAKFLKTVFEAQGIAGATVVEVVSKYSCDADYTLNGADSRGVMLIKNWTFNKVGTAPVRCKPFTHLETEVTDDTGALGQGNPNPPGGFFNHFIISYDSKYYDPSYGNGPFSSQADWENASIAGYEKIFAPATKNDSAVNALKPDDLATVETLFK